MFFEILQEDNPSMNKSLQEVTLTTGMEVTLTEHHHIRPYGQLSQDSMKQWHLTHKPKNPAWMEAADLFRSKSTSRQTYTTPVKKVVNLALDPRGNIVILSPDLFLYISASLGYHMRRGKGKERTEVKKREGKCRSTRKG